MTCADCKHTFKEGDHIQFTGLSVFHEIAKPEMDEFQYAIERPSAVLSIKHLVCNDDSKPFVRDNDYE